MSFWLAYRHRRFPGRVRGPDGRGKRLGTGPAYPGQAGDKGYFDDAGYPTGSGWDEAHPDRTLNVEEIDWIARIVWACQ